MAEFACNRVTISDVLGPLGSVEGLPPHADEAGSHQNTSKNYPGTVTEPNPLVWTDGVHEDDGGHDTIGERQQDGRQLLQDELMGVLQRDGMVQSWDDVSGKQLDSDEMVQRIEALMHQS